MMAGGMGYLGYHGYQLANLVESTGTVLGMLFLTVGLLTFTLSLPAMLSSFFGDSDISDLLVLPVSELSVVVSKALSALASSYLWTFLLVAGPLAGWGISAGAGPVFWLAYLAALS